MFFIINMQNYVSLATLQCVKLISKKKKTKLDKHLISDFNILLQIFRMCLYFRI